MLFHGVTKTFTLTIANQKSRTLMTANRTYEFVMTYMGNRTINLTLVMLFLVGNNIYIF